MPLESRPKRAGNRRVAQAVGIVLEPAADPVVHSRAPSPFVQQVIRQLVARRLHMGLTQQQVNDRLGVADRLVSKWECGERAPSGFLLWCWTISLDCQLTITPL